MSASMGDVREMSLAQHMQSLWYDEQFRLYAVVLGSRIPGLRERLETAEVADWDVLWTGELTPAEQQAAPHLVQLLRESPFTGWLTAEAAKGFGDWGVLMHSKLAFLPMRSHGRVLCEAQLPEGDEIRLDWADPQVLSALLPLAPPDQLGRVFAPLQSIVVTGTAHWDWHALQVGRLQSRRVGVLAAA